MSGVLGIDFSTHAIDLCVLDEDTHEAEWTRLELHGKTALERLCQVHAHMPRSSWYEARGIYLAAVEAPFGYGHAMVRMFGAIVSWVAAFSRTPVWEVSPQEWRRGLGLPGNAPKEICARAVAKLAPSTLIDWAIAHRTDVPQDALDAWAIAYVAREKNARAVERSSG